MERLNKEYELNINNNFEIKYGTIDRNNPHVIYICGKTWICPLEDLIFKNVIEYIKNNFKKNVKLFVINSKNLDNKYVCDFDVNDISLTVNKKNYLSFEIFIKQNSENILPLLEVGNEIKFNLSQLITKLNDDLFNHNFLLTKSK